MSNDMPGFKILITSPAGQSVDSAALCPHCSQRVANVIVYLQLPGGATVGGSFGCLNPRCQEWFLKVIDQYPQILSEEINMGNDDEWKKTDLVEIKLDCLRTICQAITKVKGATR